jgi:hypothetical protein
MKGSPPLRTSSVWKQQEGEEEGEEEEEGEGEEEEEEEEERSPPVSPLLLLRTK